MNIVFGDAKSFHKHLLKFCAQSGTVVEANGVHCVIHHSQYASYNLQKAFETVVNDTEFDPRKNQDQDSEDDDITVSVKYSELTAAVEKLPFCFGETSDLRYHYTNREYFSPRNIERAARTLNTAYLHDGELSAVYSSKRIEPSATTREEAIAELFTVMNAKQATMDSTFQFGVIGGFEQSSDDDDSMPDNGFNHSEIVYAIQDTIGQLHGETTLSQPNPSLHVTRAIFNIYDEIGMKISVRGVYGFFVNTVGAEYYEPDDADGRERSTSMGRITASMMRGNNDSIERWASDDEPPLESLDSYTDS